MNEFIVEKYYFEPYSASIWQLRSLTLGTAIQCIEPLGRDFGNQVEGSMIKGKLIIEMADVRKISDTDARKNFTVVKHNFNLSDGSSIIAVGIANNVFLSDSKMDVLSLIEFGVEFETSDALSDGDLVEVSGILKFKPSQNP